MKRSTKKTVAAAVASFGGHVEANHGRRTDYCLCAPKGKHWVASGGISLIVAGNFSRGVDGDDWGDALERVKMGLEPCDEPDVCGCALEEESDATDR